MPTAIDAAIFEAIAAIDDELDSSSSSGSDYSSSDDDDSSESSSNPAARIVKSPLPASKELSFRNDFQKNDTLNDSTTDATNNNCTSSSLSTGTSAMPHNIINPEPSDNNISTYERNFLSTPLHQHECNSESSPSLLLKAEAPSDCTVTTEDEEETSNNDNGKSSSSAEDDSVDDSVDDSEDQSDSDDADSEDSEEESDYDSDDSSVLSDDDKYDLPPPSAFKPVPMTRANSLPQISMADGAEMSTTQVSVMLNQMRFATKANMIMAASRGNLSSSNPERQSKINLGGPAHIQGESFDGRVSRNSSKNPKKKKSTLKFTRGSGVDKTTDNPCTLLQYIIENAGFDYKTFELEELNHFFLPIDESRIETYSGEFISAVRARDIDALRKLHFQDKQNMNCCNKFGESVLHTACRRGGAKVVKFLVEEAKVELRVRDDYGRTPMHDACWTADPDMELIEVILNEWPDLMLAKDKRGFVPLQYVRASQHPFWIRFLEEHHEKMVPKLLLLGSNVDKSSS